MVLILVDVHQLLSLFHPISPKFFKKISPKPCLKGGGLFEVLNTDIVSILFHNLISIELRWVSCRCGSSPNLLWSCIRRLFHTLITIIIINLYQTVITHRSVRFYPSCSNQTVIPRKCYGGTKSMRSWCLASQIPPSFYALFRRFVRYRAHRIPTITPTKIV